jgi:membrane protease YdiL (CAAX protease family)
MNDPSPPPLPPLTTNDGSPALPPARGSRLGGITAALVIAVCVVVAMIGVVEDKAVVADAAADGSGMARIEAEVGARYLVGMNALVGPMMEGVGQTKDSWLAPLEAAAKSPRQRLELDIVRREVTGAVAADRRTPLPEGAGAEDRLDWETWRAIQAADAAVVPVSDIDRQRFEGRLGWFARLALSQAAAEDDPARAAVLRQAQRTFVGSLVLMVGAVGALVVGCGLAGWALSHFARGRGRWRFDSVERPVVAATGGSIWLEAFAVYLGFMVLGGAAADVLPASWAPWPQAFGFLGGAGFGLWWPAFRGLARAERRAGFGWSRGRGVAREMGAGVVGYCAGLPIIAFGVGLTMALTLAVKADASHPLNHLTGVATPVLVFLGFLAAVWAPVVEELFFRGAFYAAWRQRFGRWVSGLATGVIFAAVHPQGWTAIPALGAVGLVFALLREWRGSIIAPVTAHALNNGSLFIMMLVVMR